MSIGTRALGCVAIVVATACQATASPTPAGSASAAPTSNASSTAVAAGSPPPSSASPPTSGGTFASIMDVPEAATELRIRGLRRPGSLAAEGGVAWIGSDLGVIGVDAATREAVHSVATGGLATVDAGPSGVWASSYLAGSVSAIDPEAGSVTASVPVDGPTDVAVGDGAVWVTSPETNTVTLIDAAAGTVSGTVEVEEAYAVEAGDDDAWVIGAGGLTRIAGNDAEEALPLPAGYGATSLLPHGDFVWVGAERGGTAGALLRLDVATREFETFPLKFGASTLPITGLAADGDGVLAVGVLDVGSPGGLTNLPGVVVRVDPESGTFSEHARVPPGPVALAFADGLAWTTAAHTEVVATRLMGDAAPLEEIDAPAVGDLVATNAVPYTSEVKCGADPCTPMLDVLAPHHASAAPTVILLHGGPGPFDTRHYIADLATALAAEGFVSVVATYRNDATGNNLATAVGDAGCVVAWARANIAEHGGDPERVVLAGHSYGGDVTLDLVLGDPDPSEGCLAEGPARPDLAVPMAGFRTAITPADVPDGTPPLRLLVGSEDSARAAGETLAADLAAAGIDATFEEFEGIDHGEIVGVGPTVPTVGRLSELIAELGE